MFTNNKYYRWYFSIVERAKNRIIDSYTEKHHIIPKSLGGSNLAENLVSLTSREHFLCHLLLTKFTNGKNKRKMVTAAFTMVHRNQEKINSRIYEKLKNEHRHNMIIFNPMKDPEVRKKVSLTNSGKASKRKGMIMSEDAKRKISQKAKGRVPWNKGKKLSYNNGLKAHSDETKLKIIEARKKQVIKHSEETKRKMSEAAKIRWAKEKANEF